MRLNQFDRVLNERSSMSSIRSPGIKREVRNALKTILDTDLYKDLTDARLIEVFLEKFKHIIRMNNLDRKLIKEIARVELDSIRKSKRDV